MSALRFWNGNKSADRQRFELNIFRLALNASGSDFAQAKIDDDRTDYPDAADEGVVFTKGIDVCVTVAGNRKFADGDYIAVNYPLMKGLLGHRLLIIREGDTDAFAQIHSRAQLQNKVIGIPATWADAELFRHNGFRVSEKGSLDTLFVRLKAGECDYVALGVNEIQGIFATFAQTLGGLIMEPGLRLYYPFALVFYVSPTRPELAEALASGLKRLEAAGEFDKVFAAETETLLAQVGLTARKEIALHNSELPDVLRPALEKHKATLLRQGGI